MITPTGVEISTGSIVIPPAITVALVTDAIVEASSPSNTTLIVAPPTDSAVAKPAEDPTATILIVEGASDCQEETVVTSAVELSE